jgi:hypothetical protein
MIANELNPVKGWPSPYAVDKTLEVNLDTGSGGMAISDAQTYFTAGKVATQATTGAGIGKLNLGVKDNTSGVCPMPIFIFPNAKDFDVLGDAGNIVGMNTGSLLANAVGSAGYTTAGFGYTGGGTSPFTQRPLVTGLVASGAYELETTAFDSSVAANLTPGRLLTGKAWDTTSAATKTASGTLTTFTAGTGKVCCGVVSDGLINSEFINAPTSAAQRLRFWPVFLISGL